MGKPSRDRGAFAEPPTPVVQSLRQPGPYSIAPLAMDVVFQGPYTNTSTRWLSPPGLARPGHSLAHTGRATRPHNKPSRSVFTMCMLLIVDSRFQCGASTGRDRMNTRPHARTYAHTHTPARARAHTHARTHALAGAGAVAGAASWSACTRWPKPNDVCVCVLALAHVCVYSCARARVYVCMCVVSVHVSLYTAIYSLEA